MFEFVTLVALLCSTLPGPRLCVEEIITDTAQSGITKQECDIHGQIGIIEYMQFSPKYKHDWAVDHYTCELGHYVLKDKI